MIDKKKLVKDFENTIENAELRALQKVSFERPLTDKEFKRFKLLANKKLNGEI